MMRVAVLHNAVAADAPPEDQDTLVQAEAVGAALGRLGHDWVRVPCTLDLGSLRAELTRLRPDAVFNLVESLADADSLLYLPAALMDAMSIRYAGNSTEALFLTTHKLLGKQRMREGGLPTPDWFVVPDSAGDRAIDAGKSWIIKGVWDQGSRGLDDDAVLTGVERASLIERLEQRRDGTGRPCFAEEFIEGREFNLAVLGGPDGPESLPPAEIDFLEFPSGKPRIVGYGAKWREDSFEFQHTTRRFEFGPSDASLLERLRTLALDCWRLFGLRGWARVDFRVDRNGQPWILEVNANPCLSPDAGFAAALKEASISFDDAIGRILED
ncbi:MAG: hypothetical protein LLG00_14790 [Planctomycetaceae bacterium]|nr:hypothetical protein [Planctomycetaceae bacterium]